MKHFKKVMHAKTLEFNKNTYLVKDTASGSEQNT